MFAATDQDAPCLRPDKFHRLEFCAHMTAIAPWLALGASTFAPPIGLALFYILKKRRFLGNYWF